MSSDRFAPKPQPQGPRINEQIRISPLRVVDGNGQMLGVISRDQALEIARQQELDLVEVAPLERPPVCKIMDYGKFKYEQTRKTRKQKQHQTQIKEIRIRPQCGQNDLDVKLRHAREILAEKDKVLLVVHFKGREIAHMEMGFDKIKDMVDALSDVAKVERVPLREGRNRIIAVLAPK